MLFSQTGPSALPLEETSPEAVVEPEVEEDSSDPGKARPATKASRIAAITPMMINVRFEMWMVKALGLRWAAPTQAPCSGMRPSGQGETNLG